MSIRCCGSTRLQVHQGHGQVPIRCTLRSGLRVREVVRRGMREVRGRSVQSVVPPIRLRPALRRLLGEEGEAAPSQGTHDICPVLKLALMSADRGRFVQWLPLGLHPPVDLSDFVHSSNEARAPQELQYPTSDTKDLCAFLGMVAPLRRGPVPANPSRELLPQTTVDAQIRTTPGYTQV